MPTTTFTGAQILPYLYGRIDAATNTARVTHRISGSGFHGYITGTDASFLMTSGGSTPFSISVDGGAYSSPTLSAGVLPIFAALTDTAHLVDVRLNNGFAGTGTYLTASGALSVTGSAPAVSADPLYGPWWVARSGYRVLSTMLDDQSSANFSLAPSLGTSIFLAPPPVVTTYGMQLNFVRVRGRADRVYAYTSTNVARWYALEKDGVRIASTSLTATTSGVYQWMLIASGLDDGVEHEWTVVCGGNGGSPQSLDAIMLGGTNASVSATMPAPRKSIMAYGDSITAGTDGGGAGTTQGDATLTYGYDLGKLLGKDTVIVGRPGVPILSGAQGIAADLVEVARAGYSPTHIAILLGRNDNANTYATVLSNYTTMLQQALATPQFTGKICAITIPLLGLSGSFDAAVNQGIRDAVTAVASPRVTLVEGSTWTDITTGTDGTHYSIAGHTTMANHLFATGAFADAPAGGSSFKRIQLGGGF